jgi:hypothetical protein
MIPCVNVKCFGAVGDGITDDSTAIRDAISAAQATYGAVYFPPGVYLVSKDTGGAYCLTAPSDMAFIGAGQGLSAIRVASGQPGAVRVFTLDGAQNVRFVDLTLDGNRGGQEQQEHRAGIFITHSAHVHIERVTCREMWGDGIHIYASVSDVVLRDCHIHDCGRGGITLSGGGTNTITIERCIIHDVASSPVHSEPTIDPPGSIDTVTVRGCTLTAQPNTYAITTSGKSAAAPNRGWIVDGNTLTGTINTIWVDDLRIVNNTIAGINMAAVSGRYYSRRVTVANNIIKGDNQPCILIAATGGEVPSAWIIAHNQMSVTGSAPVLRLEGCSSVRVTGNTITGTDTNYGIYIYSTLPINALQIIGNAVSGVTTGIYATAYQAKVIDRLLMASNIISAVNAGIRYTGAPEQFKSLQAGSNLIAAPIPVHGLSDLTLVA